jgi:hypothetical protein
MVLASSLLLLVGTASAHGTVTPQGTPSSGTCTIKSMSSFIAQGEFGTAATVGDVLEVSCDPSKYSQGAEVTITASQLYDRCGHYITWYNPNDQGKYEESSGRSVVLHLDVDGNANIALIAGPKCMVGESLITLDENEAPYETFTTSFQVLAAVNTPPGLFVTPAVQVEDAEPSGVVTIAQAEYKEASEAKIRLGYEQLADRCAMHAGAILVKADRTEISGDEEALSAIELDNNGNGFAVLVGSDSCAEGTSLIESDLEVSPFTTQTGEFKVEAPRVRPAGV